jgi:hypothetical protein
MPEPLLGCASTRELLDELKVRFQVSGEFNLAEDIREITEILPDDALSYRTVDN